MAETSLIELQHTLRNILGFVATAEITLEGAQRSACVVIELEHKIVTQETQQSDVLRAQIAASQMVERLGQLNQLVASGAISSVKNEEQIMSITTEFQKGELAENEIKELSQKLYVADPALGANKAMEVLLKVMELYPDKTLMY